MATAKVRLGWVPSVSDNVLEQTLLVLENSITKVDETLDVSADNFLVDLAELAEVHVELRASSGLRLSEPAILDFVVPSLAQPAAPTDLAFSIEEIIEE